MPYRRTDRYARQRAALARKRQARDIAGESVDAIADWQPPKLRRIIIVIDYDFGTRINIWRLYRSARVDSYHVTHNHNAVPGRIGWANFCKRLSAFFPRVLSDRAA